MREAGQDAGYDPDRDHDRSGEEPKDDARAQADLPRVEGGVPGLPEGDANEARSDEAQHAADYGTGEREADRGRQ